MLIDLRVRDVIPYSPYVLVLTGKGNEVHRVPLMKNTLKLLKYYIRETQLDKQHNKLTKEGVAYIIDPQNNKRDFLCYLMN